MNMRAILGILCLSFKVLLTSSLKDLLDRDASFNGQFSVEKRITDLGYPCEVHEITTADGYILTYHRIPHGKNPDPKTKKKTTVLLQHGLLTSSGSWVIQDDALAFLLADAGYEVWLGNSRGNYYSRRHTSYDPDSFFFRGRFWSFSWHEMGINDLPSSIDYILKTTNSMDRNQLFYIGHSMGTTMFFALGATSPVYLAKIKAPILMAPLVFPYHEESTIANIVNWLPGIVYETLAMALNFMPAGTSIKTIEHLAQIAQKDADFRQYDYGIIRNIFEYGQFLPPKYQLEKLKVVKDMTIYYGGQDKLSVPQDVKYLKRKLEDSDVKDEFKPVIEDFNHLDFIWAKNASKLVYEPIIEALDELDKK